MKTENTTLKTENLPPQNKLKHVEDLVAKGTMHWNQADLIISDNPILEDEMRAISEDAKRVLNEEYGIKIPGYKLIFDSRLNPEDPSDALGVEGIGITDSIKKEITLPTLGCIRMPIIISHEHGHAYQGEKSKLYQKLDEFDDIKDANDYMERNAKHLTEGWASLVSLLYSLTRDRRLNTILHERWVYEGANMHYFIDLASGKLPGERRNTGYHQGFFDFVELFKDRGLEQAKYAATNFVTDKELKEFIGKEAKE